MKIWRSWTKYCPNMLKINFYKVDKRLLKKILNAFKRNGLGLPKTERERFTEIQKRMNELKVTGEEYRSFQEFLIPAASRNMNEENSKHYFTREELRGLPDSFFDSREMEDDKYIVTLKYPDYVPVQKHCQVEETRKKLEFAYNRRCMTENMPILNELIKLRRGMILCVDILTLSRGSSSPELGDPRCFCLGWENGQDAWNREELFGRPFPEVRGNSQEGIWLLVDLRLLMLRTWISSCASKKEISRKLVLICNQQTWLSTLGIILITWINS